MKVIVHWRNQVLPDYDRKWNDGEPDRKIRSHYDMDVTSRLLNLQVSFRWRKVVSLKLIDEIKKWTLQTFNKKEIRPSLIFMGWSTSFSIYTTVGITKVVK